MDIIRHDDGSLTVPVTHARHADDDQLETDGDSSTDSPPSSPDAETPSKETPGKETMVIRPGEGGYIEALAEWDLQQHPDRGVAVSTVSGREEAMAVVHAVADDPTHVADAVESLDDPEASAEALRHVLVGGTPSVQAFASEVAEAEGGEQLPPHKATKIIGEVLAEIDSHSG
jgi:hypothetical protein